SLDHQRQADAPVDLRYVRHHLVAEARDPSVDRRRLRRDRARTCVHGPPPDSKKGGVPGGRHRTYPLSSTAPLRTMRPGTENFRLFEAPGVLTYSEFGADWIYTRTPERVSPSTETSADRKDVFQDLAKPPASQSIPELSATTAIHGFDGDYRGLFCVGVDECLRGPATRTVRGRSVPV